MKTTHILSALALSALALPVFISCGNDDDPDVPTIVPGGTMLNAIGDYNIYYDSKGRVDRVTYRKSGESLMIDYDKGIITRQGYDDDLDNIPMEVTFNMKGYITSLSSSWDYVDTEDGDRDKGSGRTSVSYDGYGHLIRIETMSAGTETEDGYTTAYTDNELYELTWQRGNLVKVVNTDNETEGAHNYTSTEVYDITYSTEVNTFKQMTWGLSSTFSDDWSFQALAAVGLFGIGSEQLATRIVETDNGRPEDTYNITYTLATNGSIASETINGRTLGYKY